MDAGKLNVFLVEYDKGVREFITNELSSLNHIVSTASQFYDAKKMIKNCGKIQELFLIDLDLPDGDSFLLIKDIRKINSDAIIMVMSKFINNNKLQKIFENNCYNIIRKPFSKSDMHPMIIRCLKNTFLKKENEQLNEQILHNSKLTALGELSATIVHDIRNPLSMIQLTCDDMEDEFLKSVQITKEDLKLYFSHIHKACHKINKLVDHLRNYARKDLAEKEEPASILNLIENSLFLVKQKIRINNIKVDVKIDDNISAIEILCYPNKFEQVLMNLLSNACDAMKDASKKNLVIKAWLKENFFYLSISDTGAGIPKDLIPKIFDSFYTTKPKGEGTGLGLSIVKNIVNEHLSELELVSEVGQGSTFIIKMPISRIISAPCKIENLGHLEKS